jgi:hypothetical protein
MTVDDEELLFQSPLPYGDDKGRSARKDKEKVSLCEPDGSELVLTAP